MNLYSQVPQSMSIGAIKKVFSCRPALCPDCQNNNHKSHKKHYIAIQLQVTKALNDFVIDQGTLLTQTQPQILACLKEHGILKTYSTKLLKDSEMGQMGNIIERELQPNKDDPNNIYYDDFQVVVQVSGSKQNQSKRSRKRLPNKICQNQKFLRITPQEQYKVKKYGRKATKFQFMDEKKYKNNYKDERLNRMVDQLDAMNLSFEDDIMTNVEPIVYVDSDSSMDSNEMQDIGKFNKVNRQNRLDKLS